MATTSEILPLVAAGQIDVAFLSLSLAALNAAARGARVRIAAGRACASTACGDYGTLYSNRRVFPDGRVNLRHLAGKRQMDHAPDC